MRGHPCLWAIFVCACGEPAKPPIDAGLDAIVDAGDAAADAIDPCAAGCDDGIACTIDSCDPQKGCKHIDQSLCATPPCEGKACAVDSDGDGLSDAWETNGWVDLDCNGIHDVTDAPLTGATVGKKDIFVLYDWMVKTGQGAHDHAPPKQALDQVVAAFAVHGIALHFVAGSDIAEHQVTTLDSAATSTCAGNDFVTTKTLRAKLGAGKVAYRYMAFVHDITCPDAGHCAQCASDVVCANKPNPGSVGIADLPGDDALVAFGAAVDAQQPIGIETWASTIMHELGHTLGLKHGGADACANYKPNYMSVMNYAYMFDGIVVGDAAGSSRPRACASEAECGPPTVTAGACATAGACHCTDDLAQVFGSEVCYRVDYSDIALASLNELVPSPGTGGLDENVGVGGPPGSVDLVFYWAPGPAQLMGPSNGSPIDWDNANGIQTHVQADINNDNGYTLLSTQIDWPSLVFAHQCTSAYGSNGAVWTSPSDPARTWLASSVLRRRR